MNIYIALNYGAWALSAILFGWLLWDFVKTEKTYNESLLVGNIDQDDVQG